MNSRSHKVEKTLLLGSTLVLAMTLSMPGRAEEVRHLYRGTLGDRPVSLYLVADEHPCSGEIVHRGMYRYDGKPHWLQLDITADAKRRDMKQHFVLVEESFTGIMLLNEVGDGFKGNWISPDQVRTLPVKLDQQPADAELEALSETYDELNHSNHDC
jgi:hypothetical protein